MQYAFIKLQWQCLELKQINRSLFSCCWMAFLVCTLKALVLQIFPKDLHTLLLKIVAGMYKRKKFFQ